MMHKWLRFAISIIALGAGAVHVFYPQLAVDGVTVTLVLVAVLPWLQPLFKSLELPGGLKVEFQDLEKVEKRADAAGLLSPPTPPAADKPSFLQVASSDPNLALAGLRIELERRLEALARSRGRANVPRGIGRLLHYLNAEELINGQEKAVLSDLVALLNSAVHGATVSAEAAAWALDTGPRILTALEQRVDGTGVRYDGILPEAFDSRPR